LAVFSGILLQIMVPMLFIVGIGALLHRRFHFDMNTLSKLNMYVLLPAVAFTNVYDSELNGKVLAVVFGFLLLQSSGLIVMSMLMAKWFKLERSMAAVFQNTITQQFRQFWHSCQPTGVSSTAAWGGNSNCRDHIPKLSHQYIWRLSVCFGKREKRKMDCRVLEKSSSSCIVARCGLSLASCPYTILFMDAASAHRRCIFSHRPLYIRSANCLYPFYRFAATVICERVGPPAFFAVVGYDIHLSVGNRRCDCPSIAHRQFLSLFAQHGSVCTRV